VTTILKPRQGYETIYKTLTVFGFVKWSWHILPVILQPEH
jgi:hypothetical protein